MRRPAPMTSEEAPVRFEPVVTFPGSWATIHR